MPRMVIRPARVLMRFEVDRVLVMELPRENALDLLEWLGLGRPEFGAVETRMLLPLCRRRLWPEPRNVDPARSTRPAGTLRLQTELLATLVSSIDDSILRFG
jgi:hypothetical protein